MVIKLKIYARSKARNLRIKAITLTRGNEAAHLIRIFSTRGGFDATGGVDGGGADLADGGGNVGGIQSAAENHGAASLGDDLGGEGPVDGLSGSAVNTGRMCVEEETRRGVCECGFGGGLVGERTGFEVKVPSPFRAKFG